MAPTRKVKAGGATGAVGLVVLWIVKQVGLDMDAETAYAFAMLITLAGAYIAKDEG